MPEQPDRATVAWTAQQLMRAYEKARSAFDGRPYRLRNTPSLEKKWASSAEWVARMGYPPDFVVDYLMGMRDRPVQPWELPRELGRQDVRMAIATKMKGRVAAGAGEPEGGDAVAELRDRVAWTLDRLQEWCGTDDHRDPRVLAELREPYIQIDAASRVLVGFHDPEVLRLWGEEARDWFALNPRMAEAALRLGYPRNLVYDD